MKSSRPVFPYRIKDTGYLITWTSESSNTTLCCCASLFTMGIALPVEEGKQFLASTFRAL
jgi:hypothetical protein